MTDGYDRLEKCVGKQLTVCARQVDMGMAMDLVDVATGQVVLSFYKYSVALCEVRVAPSYVVPEPLAPYAVTRLYSSLSQEAPDLQVVTDQSLQWSDIEPWALA